MESGRQRPETRDQREAETQPQQLLSDFNLNLDYDTKLKIDFKSARK